jgi:putative flippase GtrA
MNNLLANPKERSRFLRFAGVGVIGSIVDFTTFNLLTGPLGLAATLAQGLSFAAAVTSNFFLNRYWTFPDSRSKKISTQAIQYLLINIIGLVIRTPVFIWANDLYSQLLSYYRPVLPLDVDTLAHNLALGTAIGVVLFWNFFVNRRYTYNDVE